MLFRRQDKKPIENISEKQLIQNLSYMKRHTGEYAILSKSEAEYIQMLGGGVSSCIEFREKGRHYRAYKQTPHVAWAETTLIGATYPVEPNECFQLDEVIELFQCYLKEQEFSDWVMWKDITDEIE